MSKTLTPTNSYILKMTPSVAVRELLILAIWLNFYLNCCAREIYITSLKCENLDANFSKVNRCITKRVSRAISESSINVTLLEEVKSAAVKVDFMKRSNNKYNPYMFKSVLLNACKFMEKRSISPIIRYLFTFLEDYTNLNHTCPYKGYLLVDRFRVDMDKAKWMPMPPGDYGIISRWYAQGKERLLFTFYFTFTE